MQTPGSLKSLMDGLVAAQAQVPAHPLLAALEPLHCYRYRPENPDLPALWNWLDDGEVELRDTHRLRDIITLETRIGVRQTDTQERVSQYELYFDAYRDILDPIFLNRAGSRPTPPPVSGSATWAIRGRVRNFSEEFGGAVAFGIAIQQIFWLDRGVMTTT